MMKSRNLLLVSLMGIGLSAVSASASMAGTVVQQIDADTLRVIKYQGKPPHKRMTVDRAADPEAYARYADMIDYNPRPLFAVEHRGAPGKSLPRQARRVSGDTQEVAEFARFEETDADTGRTNGRMWRGAPGKGHATRR